MKYAYLFIFACLIIGCTESISDTDAEVISPEEPAVEMTVEQRIVRHIESQLEIPATEEYSYKVYEAELNGDENVDRIITVNLVDRAIQEAIESGNIAKRAEVGYIGNYNYIFYMDGTKETITQGIPVPSSPQAELRVTFENICTEAYKDILVDFRIRNAGYRRFFSIMRDIPRQVFETKIFDGLGTDNTEAYSVQYEPGTYSLSKDIIVYKADLEDVVINDPNAVYEIDPEITPTDVVDRRWFYNVAQQKYYTEIDQ